MSYPNFEPRLITHVLEQAAIQTPDRVFCIHALSLRCIQDGWRRVTIGDLACAVDNFAWWIEKAIAPRTTSMRLVYLGPNDIRYAIFVLACMKLGHCAILLAPALSLSATNHLLESGNCSKLLFALEFKEKVQQIQKFHPELEVWKVMGLWKLFDVPVTLFPHCREYTIAKEQEPAVVLYSSGTTGLPKEISLPHGYFSALDYFEHIQVPRERISTAPWLIERKHPLLVKTSLYHASGLLAWAAALFHKTHFVVGPDIPLNSALLKKIVTETGSKTGLFLPDTLTYLSSSEEGLAALANLQCVSFVGMPLPTNVGNTISRVTRLQSCIGLTETGYFSTIQPKKRSDWEYFEWNPYHPVEMRAHDDGYSQLIIPRPSGHYTHCVFLVFPALDEFCTGDLFIQHPQNQSLWKHVGRQDDMSKLQNRVLLYPKPIESTLEGHKLVHRAVVTTDHVLRVVLILEPHEESALSLQLPDGLVENIWPIVTRINSDLPLEAQITRDHILVASINKPFQTTAKGTVQRRLVVESYIAEIGALSRL